MKKICKKVMAILMALLLCIGSVSWNELSAKAATTMYSGTDGDLTWSIDSDGHLLVEGSGDYSSLQPQWISYSEYIKTATIKVKEITGMQYFFCGCDELSFVDFSESDTSDVTSMRAMFLACYKIESLDLSDLNTSNVTDMSTMFKECTGLRELNIAGFDTTNTTNMGGMFATCSSLINLDLSNFNTSNVTDMGVMFADCESMTAIDVSSFNTSKVINMQNMFTNCKSITELDLSNFNTSKVKYTAYMFNGCTNLIELDLSSFIGTSFYSTSIFKLDTLKSLQCIHTPKNWTRNVALPANGSSGSWFEIGGYPTYTALPLNNTEGKTLYAEKPADMWYVRISLADCIGLKYYVTFSDYILDDEKISMQFISEEGKISELSLSEAVVEVDEQGNSFYVFSFYEVAPAQISDNFTAQVVTSKGIASKITCSVANIGREMLASDNLSYNDYDLLCSLLNYGGYAQEYFNHNTGNLAYEGIYPEDDNPMLITSVPWSFSAPTADIGLKYYGSSLLLESKVTLRHYFTITGNEDIETIREKYKIYKTKDGTEFKPYIRNGMLCVDIKDIYAYDLASNYYEHQVKIENIQSKKTIYVSYTPIDYVGYVLDNRAEDTALANLVKAFYWYAEQANWYYY